MGLHYENGSPHDNNTPAVDKQTHTKVIPHVLFC